MSRELYARLRRVPSPVGGTVWATPRLSDDEVASRVAQAIQDLTLDEQRRFLKELRERLEGPQDERLAKATEMIGELQMAPRRLMNRKGRPSGKLGATPVSIEITKQRIRRVHLLALNALRTVRPPKVHHASEIADRITDHLVERFTIEHGPLRQLIVSGLPELTEDLRRRFRSTAKRAIAGSSRSDASRAFQITLQFLDELGLHISDRYLRELLPKTGRRRRRRK